MKKWKCSVCSTITDEDNLFIGDNPLTENNMIVGCLVCFSVNTMQVVCDEYGCENLATFGYPTNEGYKNACGQHMRKYNERIEEIGEIYRLERKIQELETELKELKEPVNPVDPIEVTP